MNFEVKISSTESYEVLLSFSLYKRQTHLKYLDVGLHWMKDLENMLSIDLQTQINEIKDLSFFDLSMILIEKSPHTAFRDYINWLKLLSSGQIYELLAPCVDNDYSIPNNLDYQRDVYINILDAWFSEYYLATNINFTEKVKFHADIAMNLLKKVGVNDAIEYLTEGLLIHTEQIKFVYLIPSFHFCPMTLVDTIGNNFFIMYPMNDNNSIRNLLNFGKTLGDRKRLEILQFLSTGVYTFTDIVNHMKLAKGTIHHHLLLLRSAGFLNIHITDDNKNFHYSIRKNLLFKFENDFTNLFNTPIN